MIFSQKKHAEPPLVQAILDDDISAVKKLAGNRSAENELNWIGFTPVEIALFLDKRAALDILLPGRWKRRIKVKDNDKMDMKEFEDFFDVHYLTHLKFPDYQTLIKAVQRCSWLYKYTILGKKMRWLSTVFGYEFLSGHIANVEIQWIDDVLGYGLFAAEDFEPNTFIAQYTGEITPLDDEHSLNNSYLMRYPKPLLSFNFLQVDANKMGNETRFINHSTTPNLKTGIALDRGIFYSFFVTNKHIPMGTQLTFNYGRKYWRHQEQPRPI